MLQRLLAGRNAAWRFRAWLDTRSLPLPGGPERTADLVAALDDAAAVDRPWLMVLEFQAQVDADKLDVTLEEVAILRSRARHGADRSGKYQVAAGLVYLQGQCPADVLDMTLPDGSGTRHAPLVWDLAADNAAQTVAAVARGQSSWGLLFWVPLMAGSGEEALITHWQEVVTRTVSDQRLLGNLAGIALVFAELAGCLPAWKRGLEGLKMTESQVVNGWIIRGEAKGKLETTQQKLLRLLQRKFSGLVSDEVSRLIGQQESLPLLDDWFDAAITAASMQEFLAVLGR